VIGEFPVEPDAYTAIVIVAIVIGMPMLIGLAAVWFKHKEKMASLTRVASAETEKLASRLEAVEKQCAKLQEQVNDAHAQLVDERRILDQKLAQKLAEGSAAIPDEAAKQKSPTSVRSML
jgi:hypothetical protein